MSAEYVIVGHRHVVEEAKLEFCFHLMDLTSDDKHSMQLNSDYVPSPAVNERLSSRFHLPMFMNIAYEPILLVARAVPYRSFADSIKSLKTENYSLFFLTEKEFLFISTISMR